MQSNMSLFPELKIQSNVCQSFYFVCSPNLTISQDINSELDELDREEFYRLKKVSGKKQRDQAAADAEMRKQREAAKGKTNADGGDDDDDGSAPKDVLGEHEDDDVIF